MVTTHKNRFSSYFLILLLSSAISLLVMLLNLWIPSYLNFYRWVEFTEHWHGFVEHIIKLHTNYEAFARRPITSFLIISTHKITGLNQWSSFLLIQWSLLNMAGFCLGVLKVNTESIKESIFRVIAFFASFTVLFSFTSPNDSYDEASQYLFIFLSIWAMIKQKRLLVFSTLLFLGILSRESTLLVIPGMIYLELSQHKTSNRYHIFLKYLIPVFMYILLFFISPMSISPVRLKMLEENLGSFQKAIELIVSLFLAISVPLFLILVSKKLTRPTKLVDWEKASLITFIINTPIVVLATLSDESRLFALPLVFLWPQCGAYLKSIYNSTKHGLISIRFSPWKILLSLLALYLCHQFYQPDYRSLGPYRFMAFTTIVLLTLYAAIGKKNNSRNS